MLAEKACLSAFSPQRDFACACYVLTTYAEENG